VVELGIVASLNRPGGNATGVTVFSATLWPKRLEMLGDLVGRASTIALLVNPNNATAEASTRDVQEAARRRGQNLLVLNARTESEFETAFATLVREQASALLVAQDPLFNNRREKIVALTARHAIPAIYDRREFILAGGLMSYGNSIIDQYRQGGIYVSKILSGAKAADLPVMQATKFELAINLKTAKALGIQFTPTLLARADEVIE